MTAQHTPGPWLSLGFRILANNPVCDVARVVDGAEYRGGPLGTEEIEANSDLIAAAPDLLKMCDEMCAYLRAADIVRAGHATKGRPARIDRRKIEAVIAKARGE